MLKIIRRLPPLAVTGAVFFLLVQIGCALYLPYIIANIVNYGIVAGDLSYIWQQGVFMLALSVLSLFGALLNVIMTSKISYGLGRELRRDIFSKVLSFSKQEYDQFGAASLITRNTQDVTQVQSLVEMGLKFLLLCPIYLIGSIYFTYRLSAELALIFLTALPVLAVSAFIIYRFASPLYAKMQKHLDRLNLLFREGLTGVKVIRAFNKEEQDYEKYKSENREYTKVSITAGTIMSVFVPLTTLVVSLTTAAIIWVGGKGVMTGTMNIGAIVGAISYSTQILVGFSILTMVILAIPKGQISVKRVQEVLDTPLSITVPEISATRESESNDLVFKHVDFRYPGAERRTLEDISLKIKAGQTLAVIGSTGDGKTSLINLISRNYDVEGGKVMLGGIDVRELSEWDLHRRISISPQKSTLFMGTVRENMQMGKPDAADEEIWNALDMACAGDFVRNLEQGLDSLVEKRGGNFSGGQKQRLCIARALLKESDIYVFDDSFSALDYKTDAQVRHEMKKKLGDSITVIVAQRISTVISADQIAVLDKGKLAGLGTHEELSKNCPVYQEILSSQMYKGEIA